MSTRNLRVSVLLLLAAGFLVGAQITLAGRVDYATFEAFYGESISWGKYLLMAAIALLAGGAIALTGGAASPAVASMGGWVGGLMGYSGAAATNAGLAFLGGGSLASGGLGVIGGTALLVTALEFTTAVAIDATVSMVFDKDDFVAQSHERLALPLPVRAGGLPSAEAAIEILEGIERDKPRGPEDTALIRRAINALNTVPDGTLDEAERAQKLTFLSTLELVVGDIPASRRDAREAYIVAGRADVKRTMPAALLAITMLYDVKPDFDRSMDLFEYAVRYESANPVAPAMQAVYFDLLTARADEMPHQLRPWIRLSRFVSDLEYEEPVAVLETMLLARILMRTKIEQSKITALAGSQNCTIRQADRTLNDVERSLIEYKSLVSAFNETAQRRLKNLRGKERAGDAEEWETEWRKTVETMAKAMSLYTADLGRLRTLVSRLAEEQVLRKPKNVGSMCWAAAAAKERYETAHEMVETVRVFNLSPAT